MRPPPQLIERVADTLVHRLADAEFAELTAPAADVKARIVALLTADFDQEAAIEAEARAKAEEVIRQGAPGIRRSDLDLRRVEQLMKQRIAKERGFVL
jgi:hypothetical protein